MKPFAGLKDKSACQFENISSILKNVNIRPRTQRSQLNCSRSNLQVSFDDCDFNLEYLETLRDSDESRNENDGENNGSEETSCSSQGKTEDDAQMKQLDFFGETSSRASVCDNLQNRYGNLNKTPNINKIGNHNKTPNTSKISNYKTPNTNKITRKDKPDVESDLSYYTPKSTPRITPTAKLYSIYKACLAGEKDFNDLSNKSKESAKHLYSNKVKKSVSNVGNCETPRRKIPAQNGSYHHKSIELDNGSFNPVYSSTKVCLDNASFNPVYSSTKVCLDLELDCSKTPTSSNIPNSSALSGIKKLRTPGRLSSVIPANDVRNSENSAADDDIDDDDIPCTQLVASIVLRGVVAYVEVRSGKEDHSNGVKAQLAELGAVVSNTFTRKVTHVVFKEGRLSTFKKAKQWGVKMVCVMWIDACRNAQTILPSHGFSPIKSKDYDQKMMEQVIDTASTDKKKDFRIKRPRRVMKQLDLAPPVNEQLSSSASQQEPKKVNMMQELLSLAGEGIGEFFNKITGSPSSDDDICVPMSVNLLRKYLSPRKAETDVKQHMTEIEKYCKLTAQGRKRLARLLFPGDEDVDKLDDTGSGFLNSRREDDSSVETSDLPLASRVEVQRKSAPARIIPVKKTQAQQVAITNFFQKKIGRNGKEMKSHSKQGEELIKDTKARRNSKEKILKSNEQKNVENNKKIQPVQEHADYRNATEKIAPRLEPLGGVLPLSNDIFPESKGGSTNTVRKRKLLPLDESIPEFIHKSLNNCDDSYTIENPYTTQKINPKRKLESANKNSKFNKPSQNKRRSGKNNDDDNKENINYQRRSSSVFFMPRNNLQKRRAMSSIVCTGMQSPELRVVTSAVQELGGFEIENTVSFRTSHVIAYQKGYRTVNLLKGIARGCWIVDFEWVVKSLAAGKWLLEEPHEFTHFSPAVKKCRLERQAFGVEFSMDLFKECGLMYVNPSSKPPVNDLKELITLCGGHITNNSRAADLLIGGQRSSLDKVLRVKEGWILDSITKYTLVELDKYLIQHSES